MVAVPAQLLLLPRDCDVMPEVDGIAMLVCKPMSLVCKPTVRHVGLQTNAKCLQTKVSFQINGNIDNNTEFRLFTMAMFSGVCLGWVVGVRCGCVMLWWQWIAGGGGGLGGSFHDVPFGAVAEV